MGDGAGEAVMILGASTLLFRDRPLGREMFGELHAAGIESVELTDYHPGFAYDELATFERLRHDLAELSLHLNSLHIHRQRLDAAGDLETDLAASDAVVRATTLARYRGAVDVMAALGGGIIVTHDIAVPLPADAVHSPDADREYRARRTAFVANLRELAGYAAPRGVRIALENTSAGLAREPAGLVALVRDVAAANVGVVIDTGHRNLIGDPATAVRAVAGHLISLHIHDNAGVADEHLLPGRGVIDWRQVLTALRAVRYDGVFLYELTRPEDLPHLRANFEWLMHTAGRGRG